MRAMQPNRVAAIAAAIISLALGVLPVIGNFDWTSTAGVIAGVIAVLGITQKWLSGWQAHEQRAFYERSPSPAPAPEPPAITDEHLEAFDLKAKPETDEPLPLLDDEDEGALGNRRANAADEAPPLTVEPAA